VLIPNLIFAQPGRDNNMKMMKKWKLIEYLDLTETQADKFLPRSNLYEKELTLFQRKSVELHTELNNLIEDGNLSNSKIDDVLEKMHKLQKERLKFRFEHFKNIDDVLTIEQKAKYIAFDRKFRKRMSDRLKNDKDFPRKNRLHNNQ
jgi:Spy/CpxP family protein refolding chaperone